jgi:DNA-directed RNA polymerase subunit omega
MRDRPPDTDATLPAVFVRVLWAGLEVAKEAVLSFGRTATKRQDGLKERRAGLVESNGCRPTSPRGDVLSGEQGEALIHPRTDSLLEHVDSHYAAVIVAAKRARQINNYYHTLGEGVFEEFPPPMVDTPSKNYITIALEEVAQGKIKSRYR